METQQLFQTRRISGSSESQATEVFKQRKSISQAPPTKFDPNSQGRRFSNAISNQALKFNPSFRRLSKFWEPQSDRKMSEQFQGGGAPLNGAAPASGKLEGSALSHAKAAEWLANQNPQGQNAGAANGVGGLQTPAATTKASKSAIDPVLAPDNRNLFVRVVFSEGNEVLFNTQCLTAVLLSSISRHFKHMPGQGRRRVRERLDDGDQADGEDGEGVGDRIEELDLLDKGGKPMRLYYHMEEVAGKHLQGRQSYYIASIERLGSNKVKYKLISAVPIKGGLKKEFEVQLQPESGTKEGRKNRQPAQGSGNANGNASNGMKSTITT